jgi:hypothetical protein
MPPTEINPGKSFTCAMPDASRDPTMNGAPNAATRQVVFTEHTNCATRHQIGDESRISEIAFSGEPI